jgi:drug/metabolite transporter (DMT)-like permease
MLSRSVAGYFFTVATACLFTSFVLGSRVGLTTTLEPHDVAAIRFGVAGLLVFPIFLRHRLGGIKLWQGAVLAVTGGCGFALAAYMGFSLAPASHGSALIHGALPLTTLFIQAIWTRRRVNASRVLASVTTCCGILFMLWDSLISLSSTQIWGDASLLFASLLWSTYGICLARWNVPALPAAAMVVILSSIIYLPYYVLFGVGTLPSAPWSDLAAQALLQGVLVGILSNLCYAKAVARLGPERVSAVLAVVPAVVTFGAIFLLQEIPSLFTWCGVLLVVVGVMLHTAIADRLPVPGR